MISGAMADSDPDRTPRSLTPQPPSMQTCSSPSRLSLFNKLAPEIIEQIFIMVSPSLSLPSYEPSGLPKPDQLTDPLILSMVCRGWYNITKACPPLWTTIDIWVVEYTRIARSRWGFRQLGVCLARSSAHPLTLRIHGPNPVGRELNENIYDILELVMLHSKRWDIVELNFPLDRLFLRVLDFLKGRFPRLRSLAFCLSDMSLRVIEGTILRDAPLLTCISLGESKFPMNVLQNIPWKQLTEVVFNGTEFITKQQLRMVLRSLSAFTTILSILNIRVPHSATDGRPIMLAKLRRLAAHGHTSVSILNILICPSLEDLEIENKNDDSAIISQFLNNSSCSLTHIHLDKDDPSSQPLSYHTILQHPALSTLKSMSLVRLPDQVLDILVFEPHMLLPALETLHLNIVFSRVQGGRPHLISQIERFQKIIDSRTQESATSLNRRISSAFIDGLHSGFVPNSTGTLLKNIFFTFNLLEENGWSYWTDPPAEIQALWAFCVSRNIHGHCQHKVYQMR